LPEGSGDKFFIAASLQLRFHYDHYSSAEGQRPLHEHRGKLTELLELLGFEAFFSYLEAQGRDINISLLK